MTDKKEETLEEEIENIPPETLIKMADIWASISQNYAISQNAFETLLENIIKELEKKQDEFSRESKYKLAELLERNIRAQLPDLELEINKIQEKDPDFFINIIIRHVFLGTFDPNQLPDNERLRKAILEELDFYETDQQPEQGNRNDENEDQLKENITVDTEKPTTVKQVAYSIKSIIPRNHVMPNNTLMNVLQGKQVINAGAFDMPVIPATKRRKEVTAYVDVSMETKTDSGITITDAHLTEYERQVYDAIVTLWITATEEQIEPIFTLDKIYSNMPGSGERATPQQRGAITKAIERFRRLHIVLDATEEMRRRGKIGEKSTFTMDNFFLTATRAKYTIEKGGQEVIAYRIDSKPINLIYAEMTKQILTVPVKVITFSKVKPNPADKSLVTISTEPIAMNEARQAMAGYLLRRVCVMKHDLEEAREEKRSYDRKRQHNKDLEEKPVEAFRKQSSVILFGTLFEITGTATDNRELIRRNRDFCYEILDYWKAIDFISDYEEQKKGRSITGIKIML